MSSPQNGDAERPDGQRIELDRGACIALIAGGGVGRIGVSIGALPAILPVNYVVADETIAFPSESWSNARRSTTGVVIVFQVEALQRDGAFDWTVMACGISREVGDREERHQLEALWALRHPVRALPSTFVGVPMTIISGQRFPRSL